MAPREPQLVTLFAVYEFLRDLFGLGNSFFYAVNLADGTPFEDINEVEDEETAR